MKRIGLVGGTGPESTLEYYKEITRIIGEKTNHQAFPELTVDSVDLYKLYPWLQAGDYDKVASYLQESVKRLYACDVDYIAFTAVTCHIVYDEVAASVPVPMVSIPQTTADYIKDRGFRKVGLLGTYFTMDNDYLSRPIAEAGVKVVLPTEEEKRRISDCIYNELEFNIVKPETLAYLEGVIARLKEEEGIEAIVLGCTELPLVLNDSVSPVPCINTVKVHIEKLVQLILSEK